MAASAKVGSKTRKSIKTSKSPKKVSINMEPSKVNFRCSLCQREFFLSKRIHAVLRGMPQSWDLFCPDCKEPLEEIE